MAKKSRRAKLTKLLDDLCREIVRIRDGHICQKCNKHITGSNAHTCHVVAKGNGASQRRFDLLNLFLGCMYCHRWWHNNPTESAKWFTKKWPHREDYLERYRYGNPAPISDAEMEELIVEYKKKVNQLQ